MHVIVFAHPINLAPLPIHVVRARAVHAVPPRMQKNWVHRLWDAANSTSEWYAAAYERALSGPKRRRDTALEAPSPTPSAAQCPRPVDYALLPDPVWYYDAQRDLESVRSTLARLGSGVDIRPSGIAGAGAGLFATRSFRAGTPITEYDGVRLSYKECRQRTAAQKTHMRSLQRLHTCIDGLRIDTGATAHSLRGRGGASFINDPVDLQASSAQDDGVERDWARINASFVRLQLKADDKPTFERLPDARIAVVVVAVRAIAPGDEIFASYGEDTWVRYLEELDGAAATSQV